MKTQMDQLATQMATILQNQNTQQPSLATAPRPESNAELPSPADTTDARLTAIETRLERLCEQIKTNFANIAQPITTLDTRVAALEEDWQKQTQHKKPKKDTPPTITNTLSE